MEMKMKLTTAHIKKLAQQDPRIDLVEICPDNQITVWLDPKWTWDAFDGNITCMTYNVEGSDPSYRDDLETFRQHIKNIELAK
jgi:hypothetical protein